MAAARALVALALLAPVVMIATEARAESGIARIRERAAALAMRPVPKKGMGLRWEMTLVSAGISGRTLAPSA